MRRRRREKWLYRDRRRRQLRRQRRAIVIGFLCVIVGVCFLVFHKNDIQKGTDYLKEAKYEQAVSSFEKAVKKETNLGEAYRGMGIAYFEMEEYDKALDCFETAMENGTEKTDTLYRFVGVCQMKTGKYAEAVETYNAGIVLEDCDETIKKEMEYNRIVSCEKAGDWENAKAFVKEYVAKYPDDADAQREAEFLESR